jgi:hypothetical protein
MWPEVKTSTMCPSDIFEVPVQSTGFGLELVVFTSETPYPCSIVLKDGEDAKSVRMQIRTDRDSWRDYEEGSLIIGKQVFVRMSGAESDVHGKVRIEVFHT